MVSTPRLFLYGRPVGEGDAEKLFLFSICSCEQVERALFWKASGSVRNIESVDAQAAGFELWQQLGVGGERRRRY